MAEEQDDKDSRTLEASETKLRRAREKGQVPISREIGQLLASLAMIGVVMLVLWRDTAPAALALGDLFLAPQMPEAGEGVAGIGDLGQMVQDSLMPATVLLAKILAIFFVAGLAAGALQGPFVLTSERIRPKPDKLSPIAGLKRIFGKDNLVEFTKNLAKLALIGSVAIYFVWERLAEMLPGGLALPGATTQIIGQDALVILVAFTVFAIPIGILDLFWKRFSFAANQRMSHKEQRDEYRQQEGDPMLKQRRQQIARSRIRRPLTVSVPEAVLILTNPTHYAVALRYTRGVDLAPVCVAKGTDEVAARIREIAAEHEIPILENRALARSLFASVEVDEAIPEEHWPLVADLVGYVISLKSRIHRPAPPDTMLRQDP